LETKELDYLPSYVEGYSSEVCVEGERVKLPPGASQLLD